MRESRKYWLVVPEPLLQMEQLGTFYYFIYGLPSKILL